MSPDALPDYYEILMVSPRATTEVLDAAYRKLAQRYHPDATSAGSSDDGGEHMRLLNEAHDVLGDPMRRSKYDLVRGLQVPDRPAQNTWAPDSNPSPSPKATPEWDWTSYPRAGAGPSDRAGSPTAAQRGGSRLGRKTLLTAVACLVLLGACGFNALLGGSGTPGRAPAETATPVDPAAYFRNQVGPWTNSGELPPVTLTSLPKPDYVSADLAGALQQGKVSAVLLANCPQGLPAGDPGSWQQWAEQFMASIGISDYYWTATRMGGSLSAAFAGTTQTPKLDLVVTITDTSGLNRQFPLRSSKHRVLAIYSKSTFPVLLVERIE